MWHLIVSNVNYPWDSSLFTRLHLGKEMSFHTWKDPEIYQIWLQDYTNQNDWPKETWKKWPIKVIQTAMRGWLSTLSLWACPCVYPHILYSFPPNKHFVGFSTFCLCGNSFWQNQRVRVLSLTTGLVARMWCSHHLDLSSVSGWELKPSFKSLQAEVIQDHPRSVRPSSWFVFTRPLGDSEAYSLRTSVTE